MLKTLEHEFHLKGSFCFYPFQNRPLLFENILIAASQYVVSYHILLFQLAQSSLVCCYFLAMLMEVS